MDKDKKRKAASVHQKLLNKARESNRPFNELLQYYAMERFLYRVSRSEYVEQFILKGALLLRMSAYQKYVLLVILISWARMIQVLKK